MGLHNTPHAFGVTSISKESRITHSRRQARKLTPEQFLALPMVKAYVEQNPGSARRNPDTGEVWTNKPLMLMYLDACQAKKLKKALVKAMKEHGL
uniref:Uncharacterized protein n=1 Tax=Serratia marcescens TaxID=615 RepID=A0A1C3HH39_SERMA|nr:Uncharacterised protein [Serratia marcescens]